MTWSSPKTVAEGFCARDAINVDLPAPDEPAKQYPLPSTAVPAAWRTRSPHFANQLA